MTGVPKAIPERWLDYKPYGDVIKGTKIVAFKVPLRQNLVQKLEPEQRFTATTLIQAFPRLKYVVDLTNTNRYYDSKEFTDAGLKYKKVAIPGKQLPSLHSVKQFFHAMEEFTATCGDDELIGVHCTHGLNRSGYLICRYLIQQLGWDYEESLKAFQEARGHQIERENYVIALKNTPRGVKIDTKGLASEGNFKIAHPIHPKRPIGGFQPRHFPNDGPFPPPPRFGFNGPPPPPPPPPLGFVPMPHPPGLLSPNPPPASFMYGPRSFRYGPPMRPGMPPPPHPPPLPPGGFAGPKFPPRMPRPSRIPGPIRISSAHSPVSRIRRIGRMSAKELKEPDFTADTFEENLSTSGSLMSKAFY